MLKIHGGVDRFGQAIPSDMVWTIHTIEEISTGGKALVAEGTNCTKTQRVTGPCYVGQHTHIYGEEVVLWWTKEVALSNHAEASKTAAGLYKQRAKLHKELGRVPTDKEVWSAR